MPAARVRYLFAYGTLMSTSGTFLGRAERKLIQKHGRLSSEVSVPGRLYCAGACPAAVAVDGNRHRRDRVFGELWELLDNEAAILDALDRYEGCAADGRRPHLYARRRIKVSLPDRRRVTAWFYEWQPDTADLLRVAEGRWLPPDNGGVRADNCVVALANADRETLSQDPGRDALRCHTTSHVRAEPAQRDEQRQ